MSEIVPLYKLLATWKLVISTQDRKSLLGNRKGVQGNKKYNKNYISEFWLVCNRRYKKRICLKNRIWVQGLTPFLASYVITLKQFHKLLGLFLYLQRANICTTYLVRLLRITYSKIYECLWMEMHTNTYWLLLPQ